MQISANLADLTLDQLVMVQQGLTAEMDKLRAARQRVAEHVNRRLLAGEQLTGGAPAVAPSASGDATAPGTFVVVQATK